MSSVRLPAPDAPAIHVHTASGRLGPLTRRDLGQKLDAGEVDSNDHYWFDGMSDWSPISSQPALIRGLDTPAPTNDDDALDAVFSDLVKASWAYHQEHAFAGHIDEVFLGAIITSTLDIGYSLIDLTSDGTHHYLRFENLEDHDRIFVRFTHLTGNLSDAKILGQRASVVIGYGEKVTNFGKVWQALKAEYKSGLIDKGEPGTISVDGDVQSQYVYVQVSLFMKIDDYVAPDYRTDIERLQHHMGGTVHALRKYLRGRFQ